MLLISDQLVQLLLLVSKLKYGIVKIIFGFLFLGWWRHDDWYKPGTDWDRRDIIKGRDLRLCFRIWYGGEGSGRTWKTFPREKRLEERVNESRKQST